MVDIGNNLNYTNYSVKRNVSLRKHLWFTNDNKSCIDEAYDYKTIKYMTTKIKYVLILYLKYNNTGFTECSLLELNNPLVVWFIFDNQDTIPLRVMTCVYVDSCMNIFV